MTHFFGWSPFASASPPCRRSGLIEINEETHTHTVHTLSPNLSFCITSSLEPILHIKNLQNRLSLRIVTEMNKGICQGKPLKLLLTRFKHNILIICSYQLFNLFFFSCREHPKSRKREKSLEVCKKFETLGNFPIDNDTSVLFCCTISRYIVYTVNVLGCLCCRCVGSRTKWLNIKSSHAAHQSQASPPCSPHAHLIT